MRALLFAFLLACGRPAETASCDIPGGPPLDIAGRADGIFAVNRDRVDPEPLVSFSAMTKTGQGVDEASGKKWFRFHLEPDAARALRDFTAAPADRGFVVLVGGAIAARHKIRTPITGDDVQISCCNPAACARWMTSVR